MASKHLQPDAELRIVLVGKTKAGKTSAMNTLLGRPGIIKSTDPRTTECKKETGEFNGQKLTVVDTPGVHNVELTKEQVKNAIAQCMTYAAPGPHVFLYVMKPKPFTTEDYKAVEIIQKIFGPKSKDYTLVLFIGVKNNEKKIPQEILNDDLMKNFSGRYYSFDNTDESPDQVSELLEKIKKMVEDNKGKNYYTSEMFEKAQKFLEQEIKKAGREGMTPETATDDVLFNVTKQVLELTVGEPWGGIVLGFIDRMAAAVESRVCK